MTEVVVVIVVVVVVVVVIDCFFLKYRFHDSICINHLIMRKDTFTFRFQNYSTYVKKLRTKRKLLQVNMRISV